MAPYKFVALSALLVNLSLPAYAYDAHSSRIDELEARVDELEERLGDNTSGPPLPLSVVRLLAERALRNPAPAGSNRAALQQLVRERLAERERQEAAAPRIGYGGFDPSKLQYDPNGPELVIQSPTTTQEREAQEKKCGWHCWLQDLGIYR